MQRPPQRQSQQEAPAQAQSRPLLAIGLMCLACGLFACLDTTAKYLIVVSELPTAQVVWMRYLGQFVAMVFALGLIAVPGLFRTRKLKQQIARSFLLLASTVCNFLALRHLRLDQTTTIGFLTPLAVALLAGPFLGEWIGWRRAIAIVTGFCGILVALRPGYVAFHPAFLFAFASMLSYALFSLITRYLAPYDPAEVTLFYSLLAGSILAAPLALAAWVWPQGWLGWTLLLSTGLYGALGHYLFIIAHRYAPASTVVPFIYITLLTHSAGGFLVFGQLPDRWTLIGAVTVVLSGLYLLHRERITARAAAVAITAEATRQR